MDIGATLFFLPLQPPNSNQNSQNFQYKIPKIFNFPTQEGRPPPATAHLPHMVIAGGPDASGPFIG
jgi:hypothetical protein